VVKPGQTITEGCTESFAFQRAKTEAAIREHLAEHTAAVILTQEPEQ
jgi:hypothetical protein